MTAPPAVGTLVGRAREVEELVGHLEGAAGGRGRLVVVGGEPGVGKSHLLRDLAQIAATRGMVVATAGCWEGEGAPPLWPWVQVVRDLDAAGHLTDTEVPGLLMEGEVPRGLLGDLDPAGARFRLFERVISSVRDAAHGQGALVVLDDLQWADRSSLHLLDQLAAVVRATRCVVVAAYRDTEASDALDELLGGLPGDVARSTLTGLTPAEVAELARATAATPLGGDLMTALADHTAGNPFFVKELVRLLEGRGRLEGPIMMPAGVRDVLDRRIGRLSAPCRDALAAAAVIGRDVDVVVAAHALGRDVDDVAEPIAEAVAARIVRAGSPGQFSFVHDLFRHAIYDGIPRHRRLQLHLAVAEAIETRHAGDLDAHVAALAHHFGTAASVAEPTKAVEYAVRAAARATRLRAHHEAVDHYRWAVHHQPTTEVDRAPLLVDLADALRRAGDLAGARDELVRATALARDTGDAVTFGRAALAHAGGLGGYQPLAPADATVIALLREALDRLPGDDGDLRCRLLARLAIELYLTDERDTRIELSADALAMARRLDDTGCVATALYARQIALLGPDNADERLAAAEEIRALAERVGDPELVLWGYLFLEWAHMERCLPTHEDLVVCARLADQLGLPGYQAEVAMRQAVNALVAGQFHEAERLQHTVRAGHAADLAPGSTQAALVALEAALKGPYDGLAELAESYLAAQPEKVMWRAASAMAYAELGRLDDVRRHFDQLAVGGFDLPRDGLWLLGMYFSAFAAFVLDDGARAEVLLAMVRPHADRAPIGAFGSMATSVGLLEAAGGRHDDALSWLEVAHDRNLAVQNMAYAAFTRRETAAVLLARNRSGDRERARDVLAGVIDDLRSLGFAGLVGRADRLAQAAAAPSPAGSTGDVPELRRDGSSWTVTFEGRTVAVAAAKGVDDLAQLLARPGQEVAAVDLAGAVAEADTGEVLDARARRQLRDRIAELDELLATGDGRRRRAERAGRPRRVGRPSVAALRAERDALAAELDAATGLGGRPRVLGASRERARKAVTWRLRRAIELIEAAHAELGQHLQRSVRTGTHCAYEPAPTVHWQIRR